MHAKNRRVVGRAPGGLLALVLTAVGLLHCGGDDDDSAGTGGAAGASSAATIEGTRCPQAVTVTPYPLLPASHVQECSYLPDDTYNSNPPSSGNHYPVWAAFKAFDQAVPRGYYVHDLEHGGVAFLYNCPDGCADEVAVLQKVADLQPTDPLCTTTDPGGPRHRILITPDPKLTTRFAAASWGWTLTADCADPEGFDAFARAHYGKGTEKLCYDGSDVIAAGLSPSCGAPPTP